MYKKNIVHKAIFTLSLLLIATHLFSAEKAKAIDKAKAKVTIKSTWKNSINFGLNIADGNRNSKIYIVDFDSKKKFDNKDNFKIHGYFNEVSVEDDTTKRNSRYGVEYDFNLSERNDFVLGYEIEKDRFRNIERKDKIYTGLSQHIVKNKITRFDIEYGATWIEEQAPANYDVDKGAYWALRFKDTFTHKFEDTQSQFFQSAEYIPSVESSRIYSITSTQGLRNKLNNNWSLVNSIKLKYKNNVIKDKNGIPIPRSDGHEVSRLDSFFDISIRLAF